MGPALKYRVETCYKRGMEPPKPLSGDFEINIALGIALSIVTCGFYNIYWNSRQFLAMNKLLGREEYKFWPWLLLSLITCGLYHVYYEYKMGADLQRYLKEHDVEITPNLCLAGMIFAFIGLTVVCDAIYQHELNRLCA